MDRKDVIHYVSSLTDDEFADLTAEARGSRDIIRSAERSGDWKRSFDLKAKVLRDLMDPPKEGK